MNIAGFELTTSEAIYLTQASLNNLNHHWKSQLKVVENLKRISLINNQGLPTTKGFEIGYKLVDRGYRVADTRFHFRSVC